MSCRFRALRSSAICLVLISGKLQVVDDHGLLVLQLAQDGHAGGGADGLLRQMVFVVARLGALGGAAAAALVGAAGADAGVAGALLAEQLLGAAGHLAAAQRRVRAGPLVGQVHQHDVVQQLLVDLAAELGRIDLDRADRLTLARSSTGRLIGGIFAAALLMATPFPLQSLPTSSMEREPKAEHNKTQAANAHGMTWVTDTCIIRRLVATPRES